MLGNPKSRPCGLSFVGSHILQKFLSIMPCSLLVFQSDAAAKRLKNLSGAVGFSRVWETSQQAHREPFYRNERYDALFATFPFSPHRA